MIAIDSIKKMLDEQKFNTNELISILENYKDNLAIIPIQLNTGQKIIRSRTNNNEVFRCISDLTYPPNECSRTDRASLKGISMFYGSIFSSDVRKGNIPPRITSSFETLDIFKSPTTTCCKMLTHSVWQTIEPLHLFSFPFSVSYQRGCSDINRITWMIM